MITIGILAAIAIPTFLDPWWTDSTATGGLQPDAATTQGAAQSAR